jgi:hypothetical protein
MLDGFIILGDRIALVMKMSIVQVLSVKGEVDVRIAYRLERKRVYITNSPDSCLAQHSRDESLYMSPQHDQSRVHGRETNGRSGR